MKAESPLISIIVPSYNQGTFIAATLDSILQQDYRPLEVWVVDGASDDETVEILKTYASQHSELKWLSEPDRGPADAVNKGLSLVQGTICGIQSSDDIYLPGAVSEAVEAFESNPEAAVVYGEGFPIDESGKQLLSPRRWLPYRYERFLCGSTFILQSSAFFRTDIGREVGGWRPDYFVADVDFWLRILHRHPAVKVDRVWSAYRRHSAQRNKETDRIFESFWRMIDESPELRRAPLKHRLAADAGRRMFCQFYNPSGSRLVRSYHIWRALITYPPAWRALRNKGMLVPGFASLVERVKGDAR